MELAEFFARRSKDPSTQCGAVIADHQHGLVSVGFNGFPRGVKDTGMRLLDREWKLGAIIHAEVNAILYARGRDLSGCTIYTWPLPPCSNCAAVIIQSGLREVVSIRTGPEILSRWGDSLAQALCLFEEAGVMQRLLEG
jgi:dCMP deaminase